MYAFQNTVEEKDLSYLITCFNYPEKMQTHGLPRGRNTYLFFPGLKTSPYWTEIKLLHMLFTCLYHQSQ